MSDDGMTEGKDWVRKNVAIVKTFFVVVFLVKFLVWTFLKNREDACLQTKNLWPDFNFRRWKIVRCETWKKHRIIQCKNNLNKMLHSFWENCSSLHCMLLCIIRMVLSFSFFVFHITCIYNPQNWTFFGFNGLKFYHKIEPFPERRVACKTEDSHRELEVFLAPPGVYMHLISVCQGLGK